jgi:hypothetical protein
VRVIEDNPRASFCYAAIHERDDHLLVAYFTNDKKPLDEVNCATYGITIKKIVFDELDVWG